MKSSTKWISTLLLLLLTLFFLHVTTSTSSPTPTHHFEGFGDEDLDLETEHEHESDTSSFQITNPPTLTRSKPLTPSQPSDLNPPVPTQTQSQPSVSSKFDYWDEDEFEGLPTEVTDLPEGEGGDVTGDVTQRVADVDLVSEVEERESKAVEIKPVTVADVVRKFMIEIVCVTFLTIFGINYFTGKKENEKLALSWAAKFAARDSIFEKNFSLLGVGEGDDSPLLLKEGQNVFKFYASGRRYCQGVLATMELKSRHDLISRVYNSIVQCKDEIGFEVYMNDESMDQVVFAVARKKMAKAMGKELSDLQRFGSVMAVPNGRKWISEELSVVTESKEVAVDLISEAVLDQVFSEKAFEKLGKYFISMHFSDQQSGPHKKKLMFKFALPDIKHMADMTRLVALVPYYIDFIGRYKLSSQARSKTDGARVKVAQEVYKEMQNARQEALLRKKADKRKMIEEAEAKLSAEFIRKKEAKERARQMKKGMPKMKMTRA